MSERLHSQQAETSSSQSLRDKMRANSKPEFHGLLGRLRKEVTIDDLLHDRVAQARLDVLLSVYSERSERGNNVPIVVLKEEREVQGSSATLGSTKSLEHHRFQLKDNEYLYYFSTRQPKDASTYLRDQDVVPVESYEDWRVVVEEPFRKPLSRVPLNEEGPAESYNYHSEKWEQNGQGTHTGIGTRNRRMPR